MKDHPQSTTAERRQAMEGIHARWRGMSLEEKSAAKAEAQAVDARASSRRRRGPLRQQAQQAPQAEQCQQEREQPARSGEWSWRQPGQEFPITPEMVWLSVRWVRPTPLEMLAILALGGPSSMLCIDLCGRTGCSGAEAP